MARATSILCLVLVLCAFCAGIARAQGVDAGVYSVLGQIKDAATLVAMLALGGLGWLHVTMIKQNREDRKELLAVIDRQGEVNREVVEALHKLTNVLSAKFREPM